MTTWNSITIENPGTLAVETLPDELTSDGQIWEGYEVDDERVTYAARRSPFGYDIPERLGNPEGSITLSGHSKYRADEAIAALIQLTIDHPGMKVTHSQEWDDDGPGSEESVYVNGDLVRKESKMSALVPIDLAELVSAGRQALANSDTAATQEQQDALRALVEALA